MLKLIFITAFLLLGGCLANASAAENNGKAMTKEMQVEKSMKSAEDQTKMEVDIMEVMTECNESFRIEMAYLEALNESGSFPDELDRTPKCFIRCLLERSGMATTEAVYDPRKTAKVFGWNNVDTVENMATTCAERKESCKCERAYQYLKCFMEKQIEFMEKAN